jgi:DNA invertase Pin-like site-specific DNA recombinase
VRAAAYARVSTERQERQRTIDSQLSALRAWAEAEGHELSDRRVFRDEGHSGARLDRPGLDALRDAARDGEVEIVGVLAPDRLARKYAYQVLLLEEFRRAGCAVAFLGRAISDDPGDQLLLQIQGAVAEYERALLGERFRRGKLQKARAGQFIGVHAPYQRVEETQLQPPGSGSKPTTSIAASAAVATTRTTSTAPSAVAKASRCAAARARNSRGVPAPTRSRITSPRL